jgi:hypothetical protein
MRAHANGESGSNLLAAGLAACVLGLVMCPFVYVAIGALAAFAPAFSWITLPPLLVSSGYLLFRFLARPNENASSGPHLIAEVLSGIIIVAFIAVVSGFTLQTRLERAGLSLTIFLLASVLCLPVVLMRMTALQRRLMRLPDGIVKSVLLLVLSLSVATATVYLLSAPAFI